MASGTTTHTVTRAEWVRLDGGDTFLAGLVQGGAVSLAYMPSTDAPASLSSADVVPVEAGEKFNIEMGAGESLWALSRTGISSVSVMRRAA